MGYTLTLITILIMTNLMLYFYGVDIPISSWISCSGNTTACLGGQSVGASGTSVNPYGAGQGGMGSPNLINQLILVIVAAITITSAAAVISGVVSNSFTSMFLIPLGMFLAIFATLIMTPMGSIFGAAQDSSSMYVYNMRPDVVMFAQSNLTMTIPMEVHLIMILFFGVLTVAAIMSFVAGRDF